MSGFHLYSHTGFQHKLRRLRESRGMTQRELADKAGLAASQISNFECGERVPSLKNFCAICNALICEPGHLL
jgi:transcriptional regulator with XRE-family HTH domain